MSVFPASNQIKLSFSESISFAEFILYQILVEFTHKSAVDISETLQRLTITEGVPAYMNALVSPTMPSPRTSLPRPVWQADNTTKYGFKSRLNISDA